MTMLNQKFFIFLFLTFLSLASYVSQALAEANYDIKQMTPAIQQALQGRQSRFAKIQDLKAQGIIGEDNQGFVKALKNTPEAALLVLAENQARQIIYQAIVNQNQLGPAGMGKVHQVFSEVQREKARRGDYIQLASGEWIQKLS